MSSSSFINCFYAPSVYYQSVAHVAACSYPHLAALISCIAVTKPTATTLNCSLLLWKLKILQSKSIRSWRFIIMDRVDCLCYFCLSHGSYQIHLVDQNQVLQIEAATDNFSVTNCLPKGVHAAVLYKAQFGFSSYAAVKKLDIKNLICEREFEHEIMLLSNIKHPNIIPLIGFFVHANARLIVYEFMHNRSLEMKLHGSSHGANLPWHIQMKIALDIARKKKLSSHPFMIRSIMFAQRTKEKIIFQFQ